MTRNTYCLLFISALLLGFSGCSRVDTGSDAESLAVSAIVVPEQYKMDMNTYSMDLSTTKGIGITTEDRLILKLVGGRELDFPVVSVTDQSFRIQADSQVTTGFYTLYLVHEGRRYYLGQVSIDLHTPIEIEPGPGVNLFGAVTCDGVGIPGVLVSDGAEIVETDGRGVYQMVSNKRWKYVFVIIPSGYMPAVQGIMPEFHAALDEKGAVEIPERRDFALKRVENDSFTLFVLGDMHLANRNKDLHQFDAVAKDLVATMGDVTGPKYLLTLGDMTWDLYWEQNSFCFPEYISIAEKYLEGEYVFHTMGNHDNDPLGDGDFMKTFRYVRDIAPSFYSFNIGRIHFIVLDDVDFNNAEPGNRSDYRADLTVEQMQWLAKDLSYVPKGSKLVISSHIPVFYPTSDCVTFKQHWNGADAPGEGGTPEFLEMVKDYDVQMLTAHSHEVFNFKVPNRNFEEHNLGAICATWWWSGNLTPGVHIGQDGAPGGYGVFTFNGTQMSHYFKSPGWPASHQFRAYDMGKVKSVIVPSLGGNKPGFQKFVDIMAAYNDNDILVNVWDYDPTWKISIKEEGVELPVTQVYTCDPLHIVAMTAKRFLSTSEPNFITENWYHFFRARASSRDSTVEITVTDRNGIKHTETMRRPKAFSVSDYTVL